LAGAALADEDLAGGTFAAEDQRGYDASQGPGGWGGSRFVELADGVFHV